MEVVVLMFTGRSFHNHILSFGTLLLFFRKLNHLFTQNQDKFVTHEDAHVRQVSLFFNCVFSIILFSIFSDLSATKEMAPGGRFFKVCSENLGNDIAAILQSHQDAPVTEG